MTEAKSTRVARRGPHNITKGNSWVMEEMETGEGVCQGQHEQELVFVKGSE